MAVQAIDDTTLIALLTGTLLPAGIAVITAWNASSRFKAWFAFALCVLVAGAQFYLTKTIQGAQPRTVEGWLRLGISDMIVVLASAWLMYSRLWRPALVVDALERRGPQLGRPRRPVLTTIDTSAPVATSARARHHLAHFRRHR